MTDSPELLADYVRNGSEAAFRELVTRYLGLVYSTAIRLVGGDPHRAQDVSQLVFLDLARQARTLPGDVMLGGWLHRDTCFVAAKTMRSERRRLSRERQAVEMESMENHAPPDWMQLAQILDETINQLGAEDRTAILMRFFEQRDFRSVGGALGSNEDAARMRVNRALEKLRSLLKRRGVALSAAALGTALTSGAVTGAPAGLALAVSSAALSGAAAGSGAPFIFFKIMTMTHFKLGAGLLAIAGAITVLVVQRDTQTKLRAEIQALQQQTGQLTAENERLAKRQLPTHPAAPMRWSPRTNAAPVEELAVTNLYDRFKNSAPKLTRAQVGVYLKANGRKAATLLAAYRASGDPALLKEAMASFPNDPQVAFEAIFDKSLTPGEERQWLNAFEQSAPNNALGNYLSAYNYFSAGQTELGLQELASADGKGLFDYTLDRVQDDKEAYLSAGYSVAEAERISLSALQIPQFQEVKSLGVDLVDMSQAYTQAGDSASAQAVLQMALNLGQLYANTTTSPTLLSPLVGMAIERIALGTMDPNSPFGNNGQTAQDALDQIAQQKALLRQLGDQSESVFQSMSDQDWINYTDRRLFFGEAAALQWAVNKYAGQ
jgi:RNA polymerase sigma factor (sigma-70 family)